MKSRLVFIANQLGADSCPVDPLSLLGPALLIDMHTRAPLDLFIITWSRQEQQLRTWGRVKSVWRRAVIVIRSGVRGRSPQLFWVAAQLLGGVGR